MNYTTYKNGLFCSFPIFLLRLLFFWKYHKYNKSWIIFSFKQFYRLNFCKFKTDYDEFNYFLNKYKNKLSWFNLNGYSLIKK